MPELPEVETVRRDLASTVVGRRVERVEATGLRTVRRHGDPGVLVSGVTGRTITAVHRHGKYLLVELDEGPAAVVVHLRMSGQLRWAPDPHEAREPHTHVVFAFEGGAELRFVDPRTFGEVYVTAWEPEGARPPELAHLGPDPLATPFSDDALGALLAGRRVAVKARLLDQRALAGLGNIYGDEVLFEAGVRPGRAAGSLRPVEVRRVAAAIGPVLERAISLRGSSLADEQYVDLFGRTGRAREAHRVHAREGQPCPGCGRAIVRGVVGGRSAYWCPRCQR